MKLFKHTHLFLSKIKNIISLGLDDANNYLTYASSIRLHKTKKIILDFEEYRYKVVKYSHSYCTYFYTMQTISIKKYVWFGPTLYKVILLDAFEVDMNIENPSYSKKHVTFTINSSLARYKKILARKAEIDNGDIIKINNTLKNIIQCGFTEKMVVDGNGITAHDELCCECPNALRKNNPYTDLKPAAYYAKIIQDWKDSCEVLIDK